MFLLVLKIYFFSHFYAKSLLTGRKLFKKKYLVKYAVFPYELADSKRLKKWPICSILFFSGHFIIRPFPVHLRPFLFKCCVLYHSKQLN